MDFAEVFKKVRVTQGKDCVISPHCSLENVVLGDGVVIRDGAQLKNVEIGDFTRIGRNVTLYSSEAERPVRIGRRCWFAYGVFGEGTGAEIAIGDYVIIGHRTTVLTSSGPGPSSPILNEFYPVVEGAVRIAPQCWLGAHSVVLPDAVFEEGVVLGANSLATGETFSAWSVYAGSPARLRKRFDAERIQAIREKLGPL